MNIVDLNYKLAKLLIKYLKSNNLKISVVESCSGGLFSCYLTDISGASEVFKGSVIAYNSEIKLKENLISLNTFNNYGTISKQAVEEMSVNISKKYNTDIAVSISGVCGPLESENKRVGMVFVALKIKDILKVQEFNLPVFNRLFLKEIIVFNTLKFIFKNII